MGIANYRAAYANVNITGRVANAASRRMLKGTIDDLVRPHGGKADSFCRAARIGARSSAFVAAGFGLGGPIGGSLAPSPFKRVWVVFGSGVPYTTTFGMPARLRAPQSQTMHWLNTFSEYGVTGLAELGMEKLADRAEAKGRTTLCKSILACAIGVRLVLQAPRAASNLLTDIGLTAVAAVGMAVAVGCWLYQAAQGKTLWIDDVIAASDPSVRPTLHQLRAAFASEDKLHKGQKNIKSWPTAKQFERAARPSTPQSEQLRLLNQALGQAKRFGESWQAPAERMEQFAAELSTSISGMKGQPRQSLLDAHAPLLKKFYPDCTPEQIGKVWKRASLLLHPDKLNRFPMDKNHKRMLVAMHSIFTLLKEIAVDDLPGELRQDTAA